MLETLKKHVLAVFEGDNAACKAITEVLSRWDFDFGFNRTGNTTDHNVKSIVKGDTQSRVSLDTLTDGTNVIVLNRTMAVSHREVFASALHGSILAWRKDAASKTADTSVSRRWPSTTP
jgi:hypothetical protein